ncbi:MAG: hypothetical protein M3457_06490 [Chloroflexota bacterium]|nr:hypothetical protein [Chloroflexota bacterium]
MPGSARNATRSGARVVLLGMRCAFTAPVLEALLDEPGVEFQAVVLPSPPAPARPAPGDPLLDLASRHHIPTHQVGNRSRLKAPELRAALEAIAPDLVVVTCFPWRVPGWLRSLPTCGCLNIHPSLLPDGRGPEPVFWAFRWGLAETGVTLHLVDAGFDTGPIVAQRRYAIPDDATLESLELTLAQLGARLLIDTLPALLTRSAGASPQGSGLARSAPMPGPDDLVVPTSWSARHAARFIHAVAPTYGPVPVLIQATGQHLAVSEVIEADDEATIAEPVLFTGPKAHIRFTPGVLKCLVHAPPQPLEVHRTQRNRTNR